MRIGIDNISPGEATARGGPGGMRIYVESMIRGFAMLRPNYVIIVFSPAWADPIAEPLPPNVRIVRLGGVPRNRSLRVLYQQTGLAAAIAREKIDVFLATATVAPLWGPRQTVLAVQFIQFYRWPDVYGRLRTVYLRIMLPLSLKRAGSSIIFTESAKNDLVHYTRIAPDKIAVIPHGLTLDDDSVRLAADRKTELDKLTGGRPYLLYVSATYGYKNHLFLIRAYARFKKETMLPHRLLLAGAEVQVTYDELRREAARMGVDEEVIVAGRMSSVGAAYTHATVSLMPSLYETFGYPVLESMAYGCPVITSNRGSMAELAQDAALLVDSEKECEWADAMRKMLADEALRTCLITKGKERASKFTWMNTVRKTLEEIETVAV